MSTVLAQYLFKLAGSTPTNWKLKGVAVASYTVAVLCMSFPFILDCYCYTNLLYSTGL